MVHQKNILCNFNYSIKNNSGESPELFFYKYIKTRNTMKTCNNCGTTFNDSLTQCPKCGCLYTNQEYNTSSPQSIYPSQPTFLNLKAENTLKTIGTIFLVLGIAIAAFILIIGILYMASSNYVYGNPTTFIQVILIAGIITLWTALIWAALRVFSDISKTLKEINSKIK